jgi:hypothetical protein
MTTYARKTNSAGSNEFLTFEAPPLKTLRILVKFLPCAPARPLPVPTTRHPSLQFGAARQHKQQLGF